MRGDAPGGALPTYFAVKISLQHLLLLGLTLFGGAWLAAADSLADRIVIVVNENDSDSVKIGEHYAERRAIPRENILSIQAPTQETITRQEFVEAIRNPLQQQLLERGWLLGLHSSLTDAEGRTRSVIEGNRISYLILCRGVPLRIRHDASRVTPEMERSIPQKEFLTNRASVDSELALLTGLPPIVGFIRNPLFGMKSPSQAQSNTIVNVARLDGPTAADAMALVDNAIEAERRGLRGRAYVDLAGPHANGTTWLKATADQIRTLGFDLSLRESDGVFPISARFDAPALYFGWYAQDVTGPFLLDGFRFAPGAIAFHIHSFSATTLRDSASGWVAPLVAKGAAVTVGNVYEPYLQLSHRPDLFLEWLREGGTVGDAAVYAIPAFSWQGVLVGDPLYRPFGRSLEEQLARRGEAGSDPLAAYAVIRRMNLLSAEGRKKEAVEEGRAALAGRENLALAVAVANLQVETRARREAVKTLNGIEELITSPMEAMLAKEAADLLSELNEHGRALRLYESLLSDSRLPPEVRQVLLRDGVLLASRLGRKNLTQQWRAQLAEP